MIPKSLYFDHEEKRWKPLEEMTDINHALQNNRIQLHLKKTNIHY